MGKMKRILPSVFSLCVLIFTVFAVSNFNNTKSKSEKETISDLKSTEPCAVSNDCQEFRALWIPFMDLQVKGEFTEENFKENYRNILDRAKKAKVNTLFVHVRPFSDALYPSKFFPWSHILTGEQGKSPGFDPLKFMIEESHEKRFKFHAWVAPIRIKNSKYPEKISEFNPCSCWKNENPEKYSKYVVEDEEYTYYNPEYPEVRELILNGIKEIVEQYDVDGINFDDYFYPANNLWVDAKIGLDEKFSSEKYEGEILKKRKESVNLLVKEVYSSIKAVKKQVLFGICPQGNFNNARKGGADIDLWASTEGYVDYLCPEIYTNSCNPILPFEKAASDWRSLTTCKKVRLYAGLGLYKTGSAEYDEGTWLKSSDILMNQILYLRNQNYDGFSLYSSAYLECNETKKELENIIKILD